MPSKRDLDLPLNRYRPLVEGRDQVLLDALSPLAEEKRQARVTNVIRVVNRFGLSINIIAEIDRFLAWIELKNFRHLPRKRSSTQFFLCSQEIVAVICRKITYITFP